MFTQGMQQPQRDEACLPLNDEDDLETDEDLDGTNDSEADSLFENSDNEASDTESESLIEEFDNNTDIEDNDDLFDDEVRHSPEYYLAASSNLDVGRLRQKRYSLKTQGRLDWIKKQHDQ
jgi:hypothetical protein